MLCPVPRLWLRRFALIAKNLSLVTCCKIADTGQVLVGSVNLRDDERLDASAGARAVGGGANTVLKFSTENQVCILFAWGGQV